MKILLRLPNWLGDGVMSTPVLELLKHLFPSASFYLVAPPTILDLFTLDSAITGKFEDTTKQAKNRFYATWQLGRKIHTTIGEIDIAISLTNHFYSALLLYATRAKIRIGYKRLFGRMLLTHSLARQKNIHQVMSYAFLLTPLLENPSYNKGCLTKDSLKELVSKPLLHLPTNISAQKTHLIIGLNPGAAYGSAKCYLPEYFAAIAAHFVSNGVEVRIYGIYQDAPLAESIIMQAQAILTQENLTQTLQTDSSTQDSRLQLLINRCGKTSIQELMSEISELSVFVSNDSGSMHIASALNIPTIGIFGPTNAEETAPYKAEHFTLLSANLACAPCKKRVCPLVHHNCMKNITPNMVIQAINNALNEQISQVS